MDADPRAHLVYWLNLPADVQKIKQPSMSSVLNGIGRTGSFQMEKPAINIILSNSNNLNLMWETEN